LYDESIKPATSTIIIAARALAERYSTGNYREPEMVSGSSVIFRDDLTIPPTTIRKKIVEIANCFNVY